MKKYEDDFNLKAGRSNSTRDKEDIDKELAKLKRQKLALLKAKRRRIKRGLIGGALVAGGVAAGVGSVAVREDSIGRDAIATEVYNDMSDNGYSYFNTSESGYIVVNNKTSSDKFYNGYAGLDSCIDDIVKSLQEDGFSDAKIEVGLTEMFGSSNYIDGVSKDDMRREIKLAYIQKENEKLHKDEKGHTITSRKVKLH